ncbi:unnamed protein product [Moneuplotes crassus]|uniref:Uncharacterized protein n=1 Tax=Euplotes crassus TaxID=5936 RepID=A0AAD2D455_EUPCR|nr:unnamed protein product [Moneuplotes crassus]
MKIKAILFIIVLAMVLCLGSAEKCSFECLGACQMNDATYECFKSCHCGIQKIPTTHDILKQNLCYTSCNAECLEEIDPIKAKKCFSRCSCKCNTNCLDSCSDFEHPESCKTSCGCIQTPKDTSPPPESPNHLLSFHNIELSMSPESLLLSPPQYHPLFYLLSALFLILIILVTTYIVWSKEDAKTPPAEAAYADREMHYEIFQQ